MRFTKWAYFVGAVLLMIFHSHIHAVPKSDLCVVPKSVAGYTVSTSILPQKIQFIDIELLEVEDNDETKTEVKTGDFLNHPFDIYFCKHLLDSDQNKLSLQTPTLHYKSWQSYLQVFRI